MKEYRRARFTGLLKERFKGDRAKLAEEAGITNGRITQLLDPDEPFGDTAARRLIDKLSLAQNYFDLPAAGAPSHAGMAVASTYDRMSPKQREMFLKLLEVSFGAQEEARPAELGQQSDHMDIELEIPDAEEQRRRGNR